MKPIEALKRRDWAMEECRNFFRLYVLDGRLDISLKWAKAGLKVKTMQMVEHDRAYDGRNLLDGTPTRDKAGKICQS